MTEEEKKEHEVLRTKWAARKLTKGQMLRCMELDRKVEQEAFNERFAQLKKEKEHGHES